MRDRPLPPSSRTPASNIDADGPEVGETVEYDSGGVPATSHDDLPAAPDGRDERLPDAHSPLAQTPASSAASPARFRWLRPGAGAPPVRRRSPLVRILVALTSTTALLAVAGLVAAAAIVPPVGARRGAREAAQREVVAQLAADERVVARVFASQRRWTDMWRESFGVLVATDRRVLYVGAPPTPLLRPREDGPLELLVESYTYDGAFTLEPRSLFRGLVRGLALRTLGNRVNFVVDDREWPGALAVSRASATARRAVTRDLEQLANSNRSAAPRAAEYVPYVVQRGETLIGLARRFGTSADVLRQLNQLRTDDIRAGQRLRVPRTPGT